MKRLMSLLLLLAAWPWAVGCSEDRAPVAPAAEARSTNYWPSDQPPTVDSTGLPLFFDLPQPDLPAGLREPTPADSLPQAH